MVKSCKGVKSGKRCEVVTVGRHVAAQSGQPDYGVQWKLTSGKIKGLTITTQLSLLASQCTLLCSM